MTKNRGISFRWWPRSRVKQFFYGLMAFTVIWTQILVIQPVEAAISQRGTVTSSNSATANVTSITVNKPTGVIAGDVMLATITTSGTPALTVPSGWTAVEAAVTSSTNIQMGTWYKIAGTSEGASYQWTWTGTQRAAGTIVAYGGVDNTAVIDNAGAAHSTSSGSGTTLSTASITTSSANTVLVASFANALNATNIGVASAATAGAFTSELTETASNSATTPNVDTSVDTRIWSGTGATGAVSATGTSANWVARVVALKPAGNANLAEMDYRWAANADNTAPDFIKDNISAADDRASGSAIDEINGYFYTVGDNATNWVIEKRQTSDGALCTSTNCGTTFGTAGRVTEDIAASATEKAYTIALDLNGGFLYVSGMDNAAGGGEWRMEKRLLSDGSLVSGFGTGGAVTFNPSSGVDEPISSLYDNVNGYLYVGGYDGSGNNQWALIKLRVSDGGYCTAANCGTQFGTAGVYSYDPKNNADDRVSYIEIDPTNTYLYVSGYSTANNGRTAWTVQKMLATSAGLCTAGNCGTQFATAGTYTSDPTTRDDKIYTMQVDSAAGAIYIGGSEQNTTTATQWRIEKITLDTGALITSFGGSGCATNVAGALCTTFSSGVDRLYDMQIDGSGGYIYMVGVTDEAGTDSSWRVQKRLRADGSLVSSFGTSGTTIINTSANQDPPTSMVLDVERNIIWGIGSDRTLGTTNAQWFFTPLNLDTGTIWLDAENTAPAVSTRMSFRLRLLLGISAQQMLINNQTLKLQYSPKVGTCDTGFVGESYQDIQTSGSNELRYHDNPSVTDKAAMVVPTIGGSVNGDPADGSNTTVLQSIVESNNFTNNIADIGPSQDGEWDFVLEDNLAFGPYCFRVQTSAGAAISSYTYVPELTFCRNDPKTDNLLRHGTYFCGGIKKSFFWIN